MLMNVKYPCESCGKPYEELQVTPSGRLLCDKGKPSCYDLAVVVEETFGMSDLDLSDPMIQVHP